MSEKPVVMPQELCYGCKDFRYPPKLVWRKKGKKYEFQTSLTLEFGAQDLENREEDNHAEETRFDNEAG